MNNDPMNKDRHIIEMLENSSFRSLSESDLMMVRAHVEVCAKCSRAYEAAQVVALLIEERAAETVEPSAFFQTRVMAALRERTVDNLSAFRRLWKSAGVLVSSMAVTTVALAAINFLSPGATTPTSQETAVALSPYSAESVMLDQNQSDEPMTYDQVLNTIYVDDEEAR